MSTAASEGEKALRSWKSRYAFSAFLTLCGLPITLASAYLAVDYRSPAATVLAILAGALTFAGIVDSVVRDVLEEYKRLP